MKLTLEQVRHVATLARLHLTPEEEERYRHQLSDILGHIEQLSALDTSGVEATSHASPQPGGEAAGELPLREDAAHPWRGAEAAVSNAPAKVGTHFAVPKILE